MTGPLSRRDWLKAMSAAGAGALILPDGGGAAASPHPAQAGGGFGSTLGTTSGGTPPGVCSRARSASQEESAPAQS